MEIIANRGSQYLVIENENEPVNGDGYIVDLDNKSKSRKMGIQQILKWGYWKEVKDVNPEVDVNVSRVYLDSFLN